MKNFVVSSPVLAVKSGSSLGQSPDEFQIKGTRTGEQRLLSGVIPAPHLTSSQASTWVKTPQVGHVPLTI